MTCVPLSDRIYQLAREQGTTEEEKRTIKRAKELVQMTNERFLRKYEERLRKAEEFTMQKAEEEARRVENLLLQSKRQMALNLVERQFKLENEVLRKNIEEQVSLISVEHKLDDLIELIFMQPTLTSFMTYLPKLDEELTPTEVLDFWFGELDDQGQTTLEDKSPLWWGKSEETDAFITSRFEALVEQVATGQCDEWLTTAEGRMAAIIVLDQFPRNIFRGTERAFAYDDKARQFCMDGLALGADQAVPLIQRVFFYLPLEHAEDREMQVRSVEMYEQLLADAPESSKNDYANYLDFAVRHKMIIDRFGHYPHRNEILARSSTHEEIAFLEEPGSSFL